MGTVLRAPPHQGGDGGGGVAARRAVIRWALRLSRREWRQQILVSALLAAAVALTIVGTAIAANAPSSPDATFGAASKIITLPGSDSHLASDITAIRRLAGTIDVIEDQDLATGTVQPVELRAQDPHGAYGQPMLSLLSGRYPAGPGQVAVTSGVASLFGLRIGGLWRQDGRTWRVTGLVENPANLLDEFALVAPGQVTAPTQVTVLLHATRYSFGNYDGATLQYRPLGSGGIAAAGSLGLAGLGLVFTGLVAVAGFTVMAQRRMRALGMLAAVGATDRNLRIVMLASGAAVGIAGALAGAAAGFAAWIGYAPRLQAITQHRVQWTRVPWWVIGTVMVLAVLTAIAAAWRPARSAARIPVVAALSGRPVPATGSRRLGVRGIIVLAAGTCFLAVVGTYSWSGWVYQAMLAGGIAAIAAAALMLTPLAAAAPAAIARRAPVAVRLALRDLGRYRSRSGAALAAVTFAVFLSVLTCILLTASNPGNDPLNYTGPNLAADQLLISAPGTIEGPAISINDSGGKPSPADGPPSAADLDALQAKVTALGASMHAQYVLPLDLAQPPAPTGLPGAVPDMLIQPSSSDNLWLYVATPALLRAYGIKPGQVDPAADILTMRPGLAGIPSLYLVSQGNFGAGAGNYPAGLPCNPRHCIADPKVQTITSLPGGTDAPNTVLTEHAVRALGDQLTPGGWLIQTVRPLTAAQISAARETALAAGTQIETAVPRPDPAQLREGATAAGLLAALAVLALTAGLIRSETARDLRTLTAAGATSFHRRVLAATTAGTLGLLGAVGGTATAYLTVTAFAHNRLATTLSPVPATDLIAILAGLPLAAALGGGLLAGREPPATSRTPIE